MTTHIQHLEEMLLDPDMYHRFPEYLDLLQDSLVSRQPSSNLSYKWDGSMYITFGFEDDKFFVATKSYWNKKLPRKLCFSAEDVFANFVDPYVRIVLSCAFKHLSIRQMEFENFVYGADILFVPGQLQQRNKIGIAFQPNVISYEFDNNLMELWKNVQFGLAIHSVYIDGQIQHPYPYGNIYSPYDGYTSAFITNTFYGVENLPLNLTNRFKYIFHIFNMHRITGIEPLTKLRKYEKIEFWKKYVQSIEYSGSSYGFNFPIWFVNFLYDIQQLKKDILELPFGYDLSLCRLNSDHEGLVLQNWKDPNHLYKIVDRYDFTRRNNEKRGR